MAEVPHTLTWVEWWYLDEPFLPRFIWIVGKLIVIPLAIGEAINSEPAGSLVQGPDLRILLRSLASRARPKLPKTRHEGPLGNHG